MYFLAPAEAGVYTKRPEFHWFGLDASLGWHDRYS